MHGESSGSKKKSTGAATRADDAAINGSLGYVGVNEIRNLFTERIRQLDTEIWPKNRTPYRDEILDFYMTTMIELMQKAEQNYEKFCRRNLLTTKPGVKPESDQAASQKAFEERRARLEKWHKS